MKIKKLNPPINGYDEKNTNSVIIVDGRLESLESALEKCIHTSSKKYNNYNFYWYSEKDYQRFYQEENLPKYLPILCGVPTSKKDVLLGYVFARDVYINIDAFPVEKFPKSITKEIARMTKIYDDPDDDIQKKCKDILEQI